MNKEEKHTIAKNENEQINSQHLPVAAYGEGKHSRKVICPFCKDKGITSKVTIVRQQRTLMSTEEHYDEEGNYHFNDPNKTAVQYRCSQNHDFTETY